jgi:hypothetical protein
LREHPGSGGRGRKENGKMKKQRGTPRNSQFLGEGLFHFYILTRGMIGTTKFEENNLNNFPKLLSYFI